MELDLMQHVWVASNMLLVTTIKWKDHMAMTAALIMELHSLQSVQNGVHCFILFLGVVGGFINLKPRMIEAKNDCGILWQT